MNNFIFEGFIDELEKIAGIGSMIGKGVSAAKSFGGKVGAGYKNIVSKPAVSETIKGIKSAGKEIGGTPIGQKMKSGLTKTTDFIKKHPKSSVAAGTAIGYGTAKMTGGKKQDQYQNYY